MKDFFKKAASTGLALLLAFCTAGTAAFAESSAYSGLKAVKKGGDGETAFKNNGGKYSEYDDDKAFVVAKKYGFRWHSTGDTVYSIPDSYYDGDSSRRADLRSLLWDMYGEKATDELLEQYSASKYLVFEFSEKGSETATMTATNLKIWNTKTQEYDKIDIKYTVFGVDVNSETNKGYVLMQRGVRPNICLLGARSCKVRYEAFEAGTDTPYTLNSNFTMDDIDIYQYFGFTDNTDKILHTYATEDSLLGYAHDADNGWNIFGEMDQKEYNEEGQTQAGSRVAAGGTINASNFTFKYGTGQENSHGSSWSYFHFTAEDLVEAKPADPVKYVSNEDDAWDATKTENTLASDTDSWYYYVNQKIPDTTTSKLGYDSFTITDEIDSCLKVEDVSVYNSKTQKDITNSFTVSTDGNKVIAKADSDILEKGNFYGSGNGNEIILRIKVKVDASYKTVKSHGHLTSDKKYWKFTNKASSSIKLAADGNTYESDTNTTATTVPVPLAKLNIDKKADAYEYQVGDKVTFTITVGTEEATAYDVEVTDGVPTGLEVTSVSASGGENAAAAYSGNNITATADSLDIGDSLVIKVSCTALESGNTQELYNVARADADNAESKAYDDAETYINTADVTVDKTVDKYEYEVGDEATFTVKVKNNEGIARDVVIEDTLPTGMTLDYDSLSISGLPSTFEYKYVNKTEDPTNELNGKGSDKDHTEESESRDITAEKSKSGDNGWKYTIDYLPAGSEAIITFKATANENGNGKEQQNKTTVEGSNFTSVADDAEYHINTAGLSITKKYVNGYKDEKNDNRADNEFRVYEDETGNELVKYVVEVTSSGTDGTVAKDVSVDDTTLPDGLVLNYDDIEIVETSADGKETTFTADGGNGTEIQYRVAGTEDVANELNKDQYNETEGRTPVITLTKSGNGWKLSDTYLAKGSKLTITYTAKAMEAVNGTEVRNVAKATCANMEKEDGEAKTVEADTTVYINSPRLKITKEADSTKYAVGDTVTYTLTITNEQGGTIARNVVIDDVIGTEGVQLQKSSITFMNSEGKAVSSHFCEDYASCEEKGLHLEVTGNTFVIHTGRSLVKEENYNLYDLDNGKEPEEQETWNPGYIGVTKETSMTVEYQMVVTDKDLAGKEVDNTASATSDEALKVTDDETVIPEGPTIITSKKSDKATYYYGEEVEYTITATQPRQSVTAEDVQIKDHFDQSGVVDIKEGSFKVMFNDDDITDDVTITMDEDGQGFTIETGKDLTDADTIIVTYRAVPRTEAIGTEITNTEVTWGSNVPEVQSTDTVVITDPDAALSIEKTSDKKTYTVGDTGNYTVTIKESKDNGTARNVTLTDVMQVSGTERASIKVMKDKEDITESCEIYENGDSYSIATGTDLAFGETMTVTYDVTFTSTDLVNKEATNVAAADADNTDEVSAENTVKIIGADITTGKKSDKAVYSLNETGHYTITAGNSSEEASAKNVVITDEITSTDGEPSYVADSIKVLGPDGNDVTSKMKAIEVNAKDLRVETGMDLAPGEVFTVTYDILFADGDLVGKTVDNVTRAYADNASASSENEVQVPDGPAVLKSSDPASGSVVATGDEVTYNITVTNNTESDQSNIMVRDMVPENTEYVSGGTLQEINGEDHVTFLIESLKAGESETLTFTVKVTGKGYAVIENTAQVKANVDGPDSHWGDDGFTDTNTVIHYIPNEVEVVKPGLSVGKKADKDIYNVGDTGHYTVTVTETEDNATAYDITIKDSIGTGNASIKAGTIKLLGKDGKDITDKVSITLNDAKDGYTIETGVDLTYGESLTVTYDVEFTAASVGTVKNTAKAKGTNTGTSTSTEEATPVDIGDGLTAVKTADPASGTVVAAGEEITYSITVANAGDEDKADVLILDAIPEGTTYAEGSGGTLTGTGDVQYVAFTIPTVAAGGSETVSFTVTVNEDVSEDVAIENVALVKTAEEGEDPDAPDTWEPDAFTPTNETEHPLKEDDGWAQDDEEVEVVAPVLTIHKGSDKEGYTVGDTGYYTVKVGQVTENATATNVVIKDSLQAEGANITEGSIKLYDTNSKDITNKVSITQDSAQSYTIETGMDLAYNETFTVTYDVVFADVSLAGQNVKNIAKAKADNAQAQTENDVTPVTVEEGLTAVKTADPATGTTVKAGESITYSITVENTGEEDKADVLILDAIPEKTAYTEGSGGTLTEIDGVQYVSFTIPTIAAGESETVSFTVTVDKDATEDDTVENVALVKTAEDGEDPDAPDTWNPDAFTPTNETEHPLSQWVQTEYEVPVEGPGLTVEKSSDKDTYTVGETGKYTVIVSNEKEDTTAENVVISDSLDTEGAILQAGTIKVTDTDGTDITEAVKVSTTDTSYKVETGMDLSYGETFTVTYDVLFKEAALVGKQVTNTATASADNGEAQAQKTVTIDDGEDPRLVITKKSDKKTYKVGGTGTYTLTVTNDREGTTAENVVIKDDLKTEGAVISKKSIKVTDADGKEVETAKVSMDKDSAGFTIRTGADLEGGKDFTVTYKVTFKSSSLAGKKVKNTAVASSDNTEKAKAANTVKVKKTSSTPKTSTSTGSGTSSGSDSSSGNVKTGDILIRVLAGTATVSILCGAYCFIKKRRNGNGMMIG